ncbi:hypothetical protein B0H66DRAFT_485643 [Apodospora peruviana]|uniref:Clr5 domain-containing protein n=1 Tax=Apodospora peruviana TaxID=516989 RepID=A0AAE0HSW0_9PEZI|nr:hypothetical protein B0H66DRAFT_485643 [Apodospora peruviana]
MQASYASPEDWDNHRAEITRLYLDQDKTLREVKEHMEQAYNFVATEKMYKTRIKKWALDKNNKMAEVIYMVRLKNQREGQGKQSEFTIRNRPVDWKDIERYLNRTPGLQAKIAEDGHMELGSNAFGIVCRTPAPNPAEMLSVPPNINASRYVSLHEEIMVLLRDYMRAAFDQELWVHSPTDNCFHGPNGQPAAYRISHWYEMLDVASRWEADEADTVRLINIQMDSIRDIIRDEEPSLISCLILFHYNLSLQKNGLRQYVSPFIANMCDAVLGSAHPLTRLWARIIQLPTEEFSLTVERTAQFRYDYFGSQQQLDSPGVGSTGQRSSSSVFALCQYAASLAPNSPAEVDRISRLMFRDLNLTTPLRFQLDSQIMIKLASLNLYSGNYDTAEEVLERLRGWIVCAEPFAPPYLTALVSSYYREMALLRLKMGRREEASVLFRKGYDYCLNTFGPTAFMTMRLAIAMLCHNISVSPEEVAEWNMVVEQGRLEHLVKEMHYDSAIVWAEPGVATMPGAMRDDTHQHGESSTIMTSFRPAERDVSPLVVAGGDGRIRPAVTPEISHTSPVDDDALDAEAEEETELTLYPSRTPSWSNLQVGEPSYIARHSHSPQEYTYPDPDTLE